ncbi:queuosine precursor transporter [Cryomorpha ignava]|uniref:Probable queuosine precursor transporter n=1 Tax=Cryomorpha ignava TaxID=101383 RepID=A0A7K3WN67_9FLAO|nr:queuosine precursor transporter [Cryomorpha ignava]NEN23076.1 queuosine precursor transporter [Cryomorpha ignava]
MTTIHLRKKRDALALYLLLAGLFITALVACNLIANKFVTVDLGFKTFIVSAGVLPYPITFLITDILSEIYGRKKTNLVVYVGFFASMFVLLILYLGSSFPSIPTSLVTDADYNTVFQSSWRVILASMVAYLFAQLIDVRLFHFWKRLTKGKMLWLRNNASTILSQLVDTTLVVLVLFAGRLSFDTMGDYILDGWFFKVICALADTVFIYFFVWLIKRKFKLKVHQELEFLD